VLPFPAALLPVLSACIAGRAEGPLLRCRRSFEGGRGVRGIQSFDELALLFQEKLAQAPPERVVTEQDRKEVFRRLLRDLGGVSEDQLAGECKRLFRAAGIIDGATLYTLRGSVTTAMERAKVPHLDLRYLTGHTTDDILNHYVCLHPVDAMRSYFESIAPLLAAITERCRVLEIVPS